MRGPDTHERTLIDGNTNPTASTRVDSLNPLDDDDGDDDNGMVPYVAAAVWLDGCVRACVCVPAPSVRQRSCARGARRKYAKTEYHPDRVRSSFCVILQEASELAD